MLEGKELEGNIADVGTYALDVDAAGAVSVEIKVEKDLGYAKVSSANSIKTNIFVVAEEIAKKTSTTWDDQAVAGLKKLLGIA